MTNHYYFLQFILGLIGMFFHFKKNNQDALAAVIAGMAAGAGNMLTRTTGAIANPNMELLFWWS